LKFRAVDSPDFAHMNSRHFAHVSQWLAAMRMSAYAEIMPCYSVISA
jgi:hypothetical protein